MCVSKSMKMIETNGIHICIYIYNDDDDNNDVVEGLSVCVR